MLAPLLCSRCFTDRGLQLAAAQLGVDDERACRQCSARDGRKLDANSIARLAHSFFVHGTIERFDYGAAPRIQFNHQYYGAADQAVFPHGLHADARLIGEAIKVGFFEYGPRLWMLSEVEPLLALQRPQDRPATVRRILVEYPSRVLSTDETFYRLRVNPRYPRDPAQYDSPPGSHAGKGRLDGPGEAVLYGSQDLEVCVHECRVTIDDALFVATLAPMRDLRLLDLTALGEDGTTEFDSLDLAVHMLFLAGAHAYGICQDIARAASTAGFDGLIYPSYFSLARTGATPFETVYGISIRRLPCFEGHARSQVIPNVAIFGRPVAEGWVRIECINRLMLTRVAYDLQFGPVTDHHDGNHGM